MYDMMDFVRYSKTRGQEDEIILIFPYSSKLEVMKSDHFVFKENEPTRTRPDRPLSGRDQEWKDEAVGY
jgi:hypothetical protein